MWRYPQWWRKAQLEPKNSVRHYARLREFGVVRTVIDVGVGDEGSPFLYDAFPDAYFYAIDPVAEVLPVMYSYSVDGELIPVACGDHDGEAIFGVSAKRSRTSLAGRLKVDTKSHVVEMRAAPVLRLEALAVETGMAIRRPCLLKVDVEGFELQVLNGVGRLWKEIDLVMIEVSFGRQYRGHALPSAILFKLAAEGFELAGIMKCGRDTSDLLFSRQADSDQC